MTDHTRAPTGEGSAVPRGAVASCWLCGTHLLQHQMVPDGGHACTDIRWYCRDTLACTERWTTARRMAQTRAPSVTASP
jgi:hypothetical protein